MAPPYRRYGNILFDLFFDHFPAKNRDRYRGDVSLEEFARRSYRNLRDHRSVYPGVLSASSFSYGKAICSILAAGSKTSTGR